MNYLNLKSKCEAITYGYSCFFSHHNADLVYHKPVLLFFLTDAAFQKLLTMVTELTREVRDLREEFRAFRQSCSNEPVDAGILPLDLPLHNMDELNNAEATLQLPEANKTMVGT